MDNDISNNEIPRNEFVDKITMELLMSKTKYNKYLETKDPENYEKKMLYKKEVSKYRTVIQDIFNEEYNNISTEMNGRSAEMKCSFDNFLKECIRYIKMKELELGSSFGSNNYQEDETIFEKCDEIEQKIKDIAMSKQNLKTESDDEDKTNNSLWGEGAIKYDMKMFARRKR
mgnify:CR=1 FL=1|jgi:hypothetical protein|tara:strand:- start:49 stop:564 length:516 start_codon:yes stop_codon:yes gene_type:complete